jgi:hypothetical protein
MASNNGWKIASGDREILRSLANRKLEISNDPVNENRRQQWYKHNDLEESRPLVLIESFPATDEMVTDETLQCQEPWARGLERNLRVEIAHFEQIRDDSVVEPYLTCNWNVGRSGYGVDIERKFSGARKDPSRVEGSYVWEAPIKNISEDFDKLQKRTFTVDKESSLAWKSHLEEVFDGTLGVRMRGGFGWTTGMTIIAIDLIGLENLMLYMYDDPDGLHKIMGFLRDDQIAYDEWLEAEGLFSLNNEGDYTGSGSRGHTHDLPSDGLADGEPARLKDLWVLSESQETVGVGPELFEEFILPYQIAVVKRYGLCYYGCCEPVHSRWEALTKIPNLRSVSVSAWCDENLIAEAMGRDYVYSRKPNPTLISTKVFDESLIRQDIRTTLDAAKDCNVELVMKDVHTLAGEPWRAARWVEIVREEIGN